MLFQELGLKTLKSTRWLRKLCLFDKLIKEKSPAYPSQQIPENSTSCTTRSLQKSETPFFKTKTNFFKNYLFPAVTMKWNKIDVNIRNILKEGILKSEPNQMFNVDCSKELKFLTRIRLGLSHLADHKFRHNFQDCINPVASRRLKLQPICSFTAAITILHNKPSLKNQTKLIQLF